MNTDFLNRISRLTSSTKSVNANASYSQWAEDLIVLKAFDLFFEKERGTYLDIGANDPVELNNTWLLYQNEWNGVLVEPNPELIKGIKSRRKRDNVLNVGIAENEITLDLYVFNNHTLSTFSEVEAKFYEEKGYIKTKSYPIECKTINEIIARNFDRCPNFISIDIEGNEFETISKFDFGKYTPEIFCVETYSWAKDERDTRIIDLFARNRYTVLAETPVNTLFIKRPD